MTGPVGRGFRKATKRGMPAKIKQKAKQGEGEKRATVVEYARWEVR